MPDGRRDADEVRLDTIKGGAAVEKFNYVLGQVLENIDDPNTEPEAERSITLQVKMKPGPDRERITYRFEVKPKLAPPRSEGGIMYVGRRHGALTAVEYDPRQRDMFDPERGADVRPIREATTGGDAKDDGGGSE